MGPLLTVPYILKRISLFPAHLLFLTCKSLYFSPAGHGGGYNRGHVGYSSGGYAGYGHGLGYGLGGYGALGLLALTGSAATVCPGVGKYIYRCLAFGFHYQCPHLHYSFRTIIHAPLTPANSPSCAPFHCKK